MREWRRQFSCVTYQRAVEKSGTRTWWTWSLLPNESVCEIGFWQTSFRRVQSRSDWGCLWSLPCQQSWESLGPLVSQAKLDEMGCSVTLLAYHSVTLQMLWGLSLGSHVGCSEHFVPASALVFACSQQIKFIGSWTHHLFARPCLQSSFLPAEIDHWDFISETV